MLLDLFNKLLKFLSLDFEQMPDYDSDFEESEFCCEHKAKIIEFPPGAA